MTLEEALKNYPGAETFSFGDSPALIAELTALVRSGVKQATCSAVADIEAGRQAAPVLGRRDIALDAQGAPALVIETRELVETTWAGMTEAMALAEGEDDSLEGWREGHRRYYTRQGIFAENMKLIWERFEVVEDLVGAQPRHGTSNGGQPANTGFIGGQPPNPRDLIGTKKKKDEKRDV